MTAARISALLFSMLTWLPVHALAQNLPPEFDSFRVHPEGAAVFSGNPGKWDSLIRERGWILKEKGVYRMWYTGYVPDQVPKTMKLGYAESQDGIHWVRHPQNPIYDDEWVEDMMIVPRKGTYYMFAEGAGDQAQLLTSSDGLSWKRLGPLDVRLTSGKPIPSGPFGTPTAYFENGEWYLFYERRDQGVWLATSRDMKVWTNVSDDPLIVPGPEPWDKLMIAMNQVVRHKGRYYAVLHGTGTPTKPRDWCSFFAVSDDLRHWKKCKEGPVLPVADNKSSGVLVRDGSNWRLFTMHAKVDVHIAE